MGAFESRGFTLAITSGDNQLARIHGAFAHPLAASVTSSYGEPVNGGKVTCYVPASGASAVLSGAFVVISGGAASVTATANGIYGTYLVTVNASGFDVPAVFHLTNGRVFFLPLIRR